jgi:hypothetical protein
MKFFIVLLLAASTSSGASAASVSSDFRFGPASDQALVVGSITYDSGLGLYSVDATGRDGSSVFMASVGTAMWPAFSPMFDDALQKKGGTFAVAVTPGQYTLQRWRIQQGPGIQASPQPIGIAFQASAGQITYLGNFHFDAEGNVTLEDRADRDLPVLRDRFKSAGIAQPAYALRAGARVEHLGTAATPQANPTLFAAAATGAAAAASPAPSASAALDPLTTASVQDSWSAGESRYSGTRFFVVAEIDGKPTQRNAQSASAMASRGMGPTMRMIDVERPIPTRATKLKLRGSIGHAAPIQTIFAAIASGGEREVVGEVVVELKPNVRYRVNGVIDELRSEVWLEEFESGQVVAGTRFAAAPTPEALKAAATPVMFTCCNLHLDGDRWISDANWIEEPFLPAGTPVRIYEYKSDRAKAVIDGKVTWLGLDYGRKQQTLAQLVSKLAVKDDPALRIQAYPAEIQAAIRVGKVLPGMTKEQAIVALGYPRADLTPSTSAPRWSYITESDRPFALVWSEEERLQSVEAPAEVRSLVLVEP